MKPIIGIIERETILPSKNKISYINNEIIEKIIESKGIPLGINTKNFHELIRKLDGIILQGGDYYKEEEKEIIKYLYKNNIPTLGICLGMQEIAETFNGKLYKINNHQNTYHEINIRQNTKLYDIIKKDKITVNSRHKFAVKNTTLNITSTADDNIIESIEDKEKDFFIGIEWHPESLNNEDTKKIFNYFIKKAGDYNEFKRNTKSNSWNDN